MRISDWSSDVCSSDLQVARRELRRLVLDRVRLEIRHGLGSVRDIPILAQRAVWMCPTSGLQESQAWKGFLPTKRMRSPAFQLALRFKGAKQGSLAFSQACDPQSGVARRRSEEHTSELQSLMRISYAVFCLKKKKHTYT